MLILGRDSAFMYGDGKVAYGDIKLDAAEIRMDLNDNTVFAVGRTDSTGAVTGKARFQREGHRLRGRHNALQLQVGERLHP